MATAPESHYVLDGLLVSMQPIRMGRDCIANPRKYDEGADTVCVAHPTRPNVSAGRVQSERTFSGKLRSGGGSTASGPAGRIPVQSAASAATGLTLAALRAGSNPAAMVIATMMVVSSSSQLTGTVKITLPPSA